VLRGIGLDAVIEGPGDVLFLGYWKSFDDCESAKEVETDLRSVLRDGVGSELGAAAAPNSSDFGPLFVAVVRPALDDLHGTFDEPVHQPVLLDAAAPKPGEFACQRFGLGEAVVSVSFNVLKQ